MEVVTAHAGRDGRKLPQPSSPDRDPLDFERAHTAQAGLEVLSRAAQSSANVPAPARLIFASEGIDYNIHDHMGQDREDDRNQTPLRTAGFAPGPRWSA
jgi:hypothetical protein